MALVVPIFLAVLGLAAGIGAGLMLRPGIGVETVEKDPATEATEEKEADTKKEDDAAEDKSADENAEYDYLKMNNQFVIPVVSGERVAALVVMSLTLEVPAGQTAAVYEREPKLRDAFLQVMFDHANAGGFEGAFTSSGRLKSLRRALLEAAQSIAGALISDVLLLDIVRQDTQ